jgi:hypothetical protein
MELFEMLYRRLGEKESRNECPKTIHVLNTVQFMIMSGAIIPEALCVQMFRHLDFDGQEDI